MERAQGLTTSWSTTREAIVVTLNLNRDWLVQIIAEQSKLNKYVDHFFSVVKSQTVSL